MSGLAQHEAGELRTSAVGGVDPAVLVHGAVTVGLVDALDQVLDLVHVVVVEVALDLQVGHGRPRLSVSTPSLASRPMASARVRNPSPPPGRRRPRTPAGRARAAHEFLAQDYPGTAVDLCEFDHRNPFELLVATILSAQCTDERVNMTTPELFRRWPDAEALAGADPSELEQVIRATGFFRQKAKSLLGMANRLVEVHGGEVPAAHRRPGRRCPAWAARRPTSSARSPSTRPGLPVDTHVGRLAIRLGLTEETDPVKVEHDRQPDGAGRRARAVQPPADPPRAPGVHRPTRCVRGVLPGVVLSIFWHNFVADVTPQAEKSR